jgi:hypothetical protein
MVSKIVGFPDRFPVNALANFDFGAPEGKEDPLLDACALTTRPITEFLEENKSILVGERGTGKTALFRLLTEGKLKFKSKEKFKQIYIPIDEELAYKTLKEHVKTHVQDSTGSESTPHRIVWELYFLSRTIDSISKEYEKNQKFNTIKEKFNKIIGVPSEQRSGLFDLLKGTKKTIGVKLEGGHLGYLIPNFYASIEPPKDNLPAESIVYLDIPSLKEELNSFLTEMKIVVYLLVDKLDEFVSGDDYSTQKDVLQALLYAWRDYQSYPKIKLKLFMRRDLYERLDFSSIGKDKIDPKKVELKWSGDDIRWFIATRLAHNLFPLTKKRGIQFFCDNNTMQIDKAYLKALKSFDAISKEEMSIFDKIKKKYIQIRAKLKQRKRDEYDSRTINLNDAFFQSLITLIFPRKVNHMTKANKIEQIDIIEYLETHFQFGSGYTTPRVILLYLQKCLENTKAYYQNNPVAEIPINEKGEYPVFLRDQLSEAYTDLRTLCACTILGLNKKYERAGFLLIQKISSIKNCTHISYAEAEKIIGKTLSFSGDTSVELYQFFAFYEHAGLFKCKNKALQASKREYELPIFFQRLSLDMP